MSALITKSRFISSIAQERFPQIILLSVSQTSHKGSRDEGRVRLGLEMGKWSPISSFSPGEIAGKAPLAE